jgi:hypothetical protein
MKKKKTNRGGVRDGAGAKLITTTKRIGKKFSNIDILELQKL